MSGFTIYAIVLTIAIAMYYTAMITIDLNQKKRSEADAEENISADGSAVDDTPIIPKTVVEGADGVVSISSPEQTQEETISEAEEETEVEQDTGEAGDDDQQQTTEDENNNEQSQPENDAPVEEGAGETEGTQESAPQEEADQSAPEEESEAEIPQEEDDIEVLNITPDSAEEPKDAEPFDASSAFDANLIQPEFGVSKIVGPQASAETCQKAALVNESLMKNRARGRIEFSSQTVKNLIKNSEAAKASNIATKDEFNRC
jgi:hypothetical protein